MSQQFPSELRYTKSHEWAKESEGNVLAGITAHAQAELRDVVYVELPAIGKSVKQGEPVAVVESVKAAFDIYAPISGTVTKANTSLAKTPQLVNQDCYGQGWFFAIKPAHPAEWNSLMTSDAYQQLLAGSKH